jgi:hypothetical protein
VTALAITGPGAVSAAAPPPWRQWVAELWWVLRVADGLTLATLAALVRGLRAIPMQARGPLFAVGVAGFFAVKATTGYLDDPRPLGVILLAPAIVVGLFALFCAWVMSGLAPTRIKAGHGNSMCVRNTVTGKTKMTAHYAPSPTKNKVHTPWFTAKHEGGHGAAAAATGGRPLESHAYSDGSGWCSAILPGGGDLRTRVVNYMTFIYGWQIAVNSTSGCGHDNRMLEWAANLLPAAQRDDAHHAAKAKARSAQTTHAGLRNEIATSLVKHGRWGGGGGGRYHLGGY